MSWSKSHRIEEESIFNADEIHFRFNHYDGRPLNMKGETMVK